MNIKKENIEKWCRALRSGEYEQSRGAMQTHQGFCCLGVACKVFIDDKNLKYNVVGWLKGLEPDCQVNSPIWLRNVNDIFYSIAGVRLCELNDSGFSSYDLYNSKGPLTFNEIADLLEAVFIYKVI